MRSIFRSFLVTIPSSNNLIYIGHLSERDWQGVCDCLKIALMGIK
jgi:mRNA interferase MazF